MGLAQAGATVGVHGRDEERIKKTCSMIEELNGKAIPLIADLEEVENCRRLIAEAHEKLGRLDILINCAAMNRRKLIADVTQDDFDTIVAVNLRSVYFLSKAIYPIMRAQGGGKIVDRKSVV